MIKQNSVPGDGRNMQCDSFLYLEYVGRREMVVLLFIINPTYLLDSIINLVRLVFCRSLTDSGYKSIIYFQSLADIE